MATMDFSHSIVSDLVYRGIQCWHQYNTNRTLVDLLWRMEICQHQSIDFSVLPEEQLCEECSCVCGVEQCANGVEPVRIIHKKRLGKCGCDCRCSFKCIKYD
ncbi:hypothetical protein DICVIV_08349 [Dictyocaulus viviparus]|uniref:Uncharacterized protein n=1 Tax=Dictyocaulus viviparus TaxID=29172 RepID=A0A0D8XLT8_DICVI|nr:hypothetical protein DICVIV_08349 [Dictyocaulus viviparus]